MKFVIRSLLFVNLLLQMTNSLRQCFNHDQNIMITIILLAFSVIGLIGLVIGNRFILIIFSASMTLILIASITIYAIGKTEEDTLKPKVPYYTTREAYQDTIEKRFRGQVDEKKDHKFRSLVDRWLTNNSSKIGREEAMRAKNRQRSYIRTRNGTTAIQQQRFDSARAKLSLKKNPTSIVRQQMTQATTKVISPLLLDELSDEPTLDVPEVTNVNSRNLATSSQPQQQQQSSSIAIQAAKDTDQKLALAPVGKQLQPPIDEPNQENDEEDASNSEDKVESEQWVAYERYLYEQYLNIVSQSIDLVMHTILAAWMALLLDEDSDQCFGPKTSPTSSMPGIGRAGSKAPPVYNYNGVRYSIRPDVDDSLARVVVN